MNLDELRDLIDYYMNEDGAIRIYYQNNQGNRSIRVLEPLRWENDYLFRAYCHLSEEERSFKLRSILEIQSFDTLDDALNYDAAPPQMDTEAVVPQVRPVQRPAQMTDAKTRAVGDSAQVFSQVTNTDEWSRLLEYYAHCLIREYQQQYELDRENIRPISLPNGEVEKFLQGETTLDYIKGKRLQQNPIVDFILKNKQDNSKQLCLGYPFLVLGTNEIYPLIYTQIDIKEDDERVVLQADRFEVSYAALKSLRMEEDEILIFLEEYEQVSPGVGQTMIGALQDILIDKVSGIFQTQIPVRSDRVEPVSVYEAPALFWVSGNNITGNLINELHELAGRQWSDVSDAMKQLLTIQPDHDYPEVQDTDRDPGLYVTPVNPQQAKAVQTSRCEPILIVTGPPGTGKSQLVLNIITQAFMNGETVLFASRNNRAVDVVMNRLQNELDFQGAIRTGKTEYRAKAAQFMRAALNSLESSYSAQAFHDIQQSYDQARQNAFSAQDNLQDVRKLSGLLTSYKSEREAYLSFLPKHVIKIVESHIPSYRANELDTLQNNLSVFLANGLELNDLKSRLEKELMGIEVRNTAGSSLVDELQLFENQWGTFGGGFLNKGHGQNIVDIRAHLQQWFDLISALELLTQQAKVSEEISHKNHQLRSLKEQLPGDLIEHMPRYAAAFFETELSFLVSQLEDLVSWFKIYLNPPAGLIARLIHWLKVRRHLMTKSSHLTSLQEKLGVKILKATEIRMLGAEGLLVASEELSSFVSTVLLQQSLQESESLLRKINSDCETKMGVVPEPVKNDLDKLSRFDFDNHMLSEKLNEIQSNITSLADLTNQLGERVNRKIRNNEDRLSSLKEFATSPAGQDDRLWELRIPVDPEVIISHVTKWHNILAFWKAQAGMIHVQKQLAKLPVEEKAILNVKVTSEQLMGVSGDLLRMTWSDRTLKANNELMQKVRDYVSAVEALTGTYDRENYRHFKSIEETNLAHAVKIFPVWATTNLAAKSNFPLSNGYFDVVIIDEASQSDIPSALPLLYRAKRIVIIGDPNQLRHVATLKQEVDLDLASRYGVGPDAYSYKVHSLFDLGSRSAGTHPGSLLLNEHYRSDHRIISFSNRVFYDNKLVIKTDLSVRNIRKTFLNQYGGIFWVNVPGQAEPVHNSRCNTMELSAIQSLVPKLQRSLQELEMGNASLGIVTPYREQESRIQSWLRGNPALEGQVVAGTAHKFQGDEKDFMVFSTVAAPGMTEGSLGWLDKEKNLLNVAVTRARISLIVAGNWNYCKSLPASHAFRQLADYVDEQGRVLPGLESLPFFGGSIPNIVGYLTDPHNPEHNRTTLRRFISTCKEFVWWVDPYFTNRVVDLFWDVFQDSTITIKQIRLLTAIEQTLPGDENQKPSLNQQKFNEFTSELARRGIDIQLRILERRKLPHDRLFYAPSQSINMPPFSGAYGDHRHVSEYTRSLTEKELFLKYWDQAKAGT